jgi:8-amino-7-oxononanoate synthase
MMSSFTQHRSLKKAHDLQAANLYPFFRPIEETDAARVVCRKKRLIMISSNNYLGLTHHPYVQEAAIKAIEKYGTGCTGSRLLNGTFSIHEELEEKLANYIGHEKAIVYSTGMQVNLGSIAALCGPRDGVFSDKENHASIIDAHRLSLGHTMKFKHNDMEDLENIIREQQGKFDRLMVVTDGVFSMTGDVARMPELVKLCQRYGILLYVDDAHGLGVMGPYGKGTAAHFNLVNKVDFNMGTFSKSFASIGGFISGSRDGINYVKHLSRTFMFSAALPPSAVATVSACLDLVSQDETLVKKLWDNVDFMRKVFSDLGFDTLDSQTPIIPIVVQDELTAMKITQFMEDHGVFVTPVIPPGTPQGLSIIRTSFSAAHSQEDLIFCAEVFHKMAKAFNLPRRVHPQQTLMRPHDCQRNL